MEAKAEENLKKNQKAERMQKLVKNKTAAHAKKIKNAEYVGQIFDFIEEAEAVIKRGQRAIATTLTKENGRRPHRIFKGKRDKNKLCTQ